MKTIRLHGALAEKFGSTFKLAVKNPAEAVKALCVNLEGFESHLVNSRAADVLYQVKVDGLEVGKDELNFPASKEIHIIPVIAGAASGTAKLIVGAVLVTAGILLTVFSSGTAATIGGYMISAGVGLMLGGVIQLLTPVPKAPEPSEDPENKPSYVFNGPVNTTAQGQPVPIGYGRLIIGSAVVSAGIVIDDISPDPNYYVWDGTLGGITK